MAYLLTGHRCVDNMKRLLLTTSIALITISICSWASEDIQSTYEKLLMETNSQIKKAQKANGLWRDTKKILDEAKQLSESNDFPAAIKLLNESNAQAQLGLHQANSQKDTELVPYYLK